MQDALIKFKKTLNSILETKTKIKEKPSNINYNFLKIKKEQEFRKNPDIIEKLFKLYSNKMSNEDFMEEYPTLEHYIDEKIKIEVNKFIETTKQKTC